MNTATQKRLTVIISSVTLAAVVLLCFFLPDIAILSLDRRESGTVFSSELLPTVSTDEVTLTEQLWLVRNYSNSVYVGEEYTDFTAEQAYACVLDELDAINAIAEGYGYGLFHTDGATLDSFDVRVYSSDTSGSAVVWGMVILRYDGTAVNVLMSDGTGKILGFSMYGGNGVFDAGHSTDSEDNSYSSEYAKLITSVFAQYLGLSMADYTTDVSCYPGDSEMTDGASAVIGEPYTSYSVSVLDDDSRPIIHAFISESGDIFMNM